MRCPQPAGIRGSLKWMQWVANEAAPAIEPLIVSAVRGARRIRWLSPLVHDQFAEYRDAAFLRLIGCGHLVDNLKVFWPARGPQWDGLAAADSGQIILIEAKAHIREVLSPPTQATGRSLLRIQASLDATAGFCGAKPRAPWPDAFYQIANRLAHLYFLRSNGVDAYLGFMDFVGDDEMNGPSSEEAWDCAYEVVQYAMDLSARHQLSKFVFHVRPDVRTLKRP